MMLMLLRLAIYEAFLLLVFVDLGFPYYGGGFILLGIGICFLGNGQRSKASGKSSHQAHPDESEQ